MTQPNDLLPEGLEDRLPREAATTTRVMRSIQDVMHGHGYDRVLPPMIEFEKSLAARMAGIQSRRMFRFTDPSSLRMMGLRSDHTPQIGRIAQMPQVKEKLLVQGFEVLPPNSPEAARKLIEDDQAVWLPIIKQSGAKAE